MAKKKSAKKTKINKKKIASRVRPKTKPKTASKNYIKIGEQIWPIEANIFARPARMKYVRKLIEPQSCVFCTAAGSEPKIETLCVFQSQFSQIVINKFPYNSGHVLILPKRHCGDLLALSPEEYSDLMLTLKFATQAVREIYNPAGFNIGLNNGATAGAGIPEHLHFHIVPRWNGDLNFFPLIAETKLVIEDAEASYERYLKYFQGHGQQAKEF